ncbi:MAG: endospore germination permease [Gorillibacterium sp.]|nr:endospore germination permease [Gorillibacterium sp.]
MSRILISQRQFTFLLASLFVSTSLINLPSFLIRIAGGDAVFSLIIPTIYTIGIVAFYVWLAKLYPDTNLFEISNIVFGRILGGLFNILILVHIWFVFIRDIRLYNFFIKVTLLPNTPTDIVMLLFFIVLMYFGVSSIEVAARINELVYPVLFLSQLLLPIILWNQFSVYRIDPFFIEPITSVIANGLVGASWYGDIVILGAFLHTLKSHKQLQAGSRFAIMLATFTILMVTELSILVFGTHIAAHQIYPSYSLALQMYLSDFLDRLEQPFFWISFPALVISTVITFIAMMLGIASFSKTRKYGGFSRPFGILMLVTTLMAFRGSIDVYLFSNYGLPAYVLTTQPLIILAMIIAASIKQRRKKGQTSTTHAEPGGEICDSSVPKDDKKQRGKRRKWVWTQNRWMNFTHGLLALAVFSVFVGYLTGMDQQMIATWSAVLYGLCITLAVFTTFMETKQATKESKPTQ